MVTNFQSKKDNVGDIKNSFASVLKAGNYKPVMPSESSPEIVLDESCVSEKDLSCSLMGKIKDINALPNLYVILANEGFDNVNLTYLGDIDGNANVFDNDKEIDHVSESSCINDHGVELEKQDSGNEQKIILEYPFGIYELLNKNKDKEDSKDEDPTFPHGFTPKVVDDTVGGSILQVMEDLVEVGQTMGYNMEWCLKNIEAIVGLQGDSQFKVNFVAIQETKLENINFFSIKALWGNFAYDFAVSPSMGYSGGLLCVWDPNMFSKESVTISDSFLAIRGANAFNRFISSAGLIDLPLEGKGNEGLVIERTSLLKDLQDINARYS
ncbi:hypothetical protein Tco_0735107 [Tanacetum coccineum]